MTQKKKKKSQVNIETITLELQNNKNHQKHHKISNKTSKFTN